MLKSKPGRHVNAFILLFLSKKPSYGLDLLKSFQSELTINEVDSAAIYRALKKMESSGLVESHWDTSQSGAAKKYYTITKSGHQMLTEFEKDIELRQKNFEYFLSEYKKLKL